MQQLEFVEPHRLEWRDVPDPTLEDDVSALVRPVAVTTCDLDGPTIRGETPLAMLAPFPFGHEFIADVVAVGAAVRSAAIGQRVCVPFQISCGACPRCRAGLTGSCSAVPPRSMFGFPAPVGGVWGGALADLVRVPFADAMLVPLPGGIAPAAVASLSDNIPDAWRTVAPHLRATPGADVLIVAGSGHSIALYAAAIAVALGAGKVDFIDVDPTRLALAERLGARPIEGPAPERAGRYAITVDASANPDGLACALRSVAPGGVCTSIGIYYGNMTPVPLLDMYGTGICFHTGRANARADMPAVLDLIVSGRLRPELINSETVEWDAAPDALRDPSMKPVFVR
jgi:alcohol dehydrogenase